MTTIRLRALEEADAPRTLSFRSNAEANRMYLGHVFPKTLSLEQRWIAGLPGHEPRMVTFGIEAEKDGLVGFTQLKDVDFINRRCEFAIFIGSDHQQCGYGREGTRLIIDYAFSTLDLRKVYLHVLAINAGAIHLYKRSGFREVGILRQHAYRDGECLDVQIMELLRTDWEAHDGSD